MVTVTVGNKREVPPGMPITAWADRVREVLAMDLSRLPFYDNRMEYLSPADLQKIRAKAVVWREITGKWPENLEVWWEIRQARKHGVLPHESTVANVEVRTDGVTVCGHCGARWSPPAPARCGLCDAAWKESTHA